ncbi:hypothetical protein [Sphingobium lactosutens]|uniref:Uncharacterized protein n=1 Tax=Sphingobium lactosutens DS20 TaxID=1331060 RepID=T0HKG0_9SPHN|nr:hypothetical protein [Sphingobium lactosutens]EQB12668.1 hypothetical protein RLDS_19355 [Sphingobium lactosutens DS20]
MDLTVIGFVIAVVGIVLQLADAFPEHREVRKAIFLMSIGLFLGIVASAALGAQYQITGNIDRQFALLFGLAGLAAVFAFTAIFLPDVDRRNVAMSASLGSALAFCATGLFIVLGAVPNVTNQYSTDEIAVLADHAQRSGQKQLAIERLQELSNRAYSTTVKRQIAQRIREIEESQGQDQSGR